MQANTKNKRLALVFLPLVIVALLVWLWISAEQKQSYKTMRIGDITLYVPKTFLTEEKQDIEGMVRDFLGGVTGTRQFTGYADELLPSTLVSDENIAGSSIIWTLQPHSDAVLPATEGPHLSGGVGKVDTMTANDRALLMGTAPYTKRSISHDQSAGIFRLTSNSQNGADLIYTNIGPSDTRTAPLYHTAWLAHCIHLRSLRSGGPWGRCTRQFTVGELLVQIHYDGRLVSHTATVTEAVSATIEGWQQAPAR